MVGVVDLGWFGSVGPGQAAGVGDDGLPVALGDRVWSGPQAKNNMSASVAAAGGPVDGVVNLAVIAGLVQLGRVQPPSRE